MDLALNQLVTIALNPGDVLTLRNAPTDQALLTVVSGLNLNAGTRIPHSGAQDYTFNSAGRLVLQATKGSVSFGTTPFVTVAGTTPASSMQMQDITQAMHDAPTVAMIQDTKTIYRLNVAPYTKWASDGSGLVEVGSGSGGGSTTYAALTDKATVDLPATNTPLAAALATKASSLPVGTPIGATGDITLGGQGNRLTLVTVGGTSQSIKDDATGLWTADDSIELGADVNGTTTVVGDGAGGNATLRVPVGYKATFKQYGIFTAIRAKVNEWWSTTPDMETWDGGSPSAGLQTAKVRRGTAAAWTSANPTLAAGQMGWETDTNKLKIGDGATAWTSLAYFTPGGGISLYAGANVAVPLDTTLNTLVTQAIPGGLMGPNGYIEVRLNFSRASAGANTALPQVSYGAAGMGNSTTIAAANLAWTTNLVIMNRGSNAVQRAWPLGRGPTFSGGTDNAYSASTVDSTASQNLVIKIQNTATESVQMTLEHWSAKVFYVA